MMPADAIAASFWLAILPTSTRWPTAAAVASTSSATTLARSKQRRTSGFQTSAMRPPKAGWQGGCPCRIPEGDEAAEGGLAAWTVRVEVRERDELGRARSRGAR